MEATENRWLFSRTTDLSVFLGSAIASLLLLALGWQLGLLDESTPGWTWITAILMIDVAHVWSTSFRTYFDTEELKSRLWLYLLVPSLGYLFGVLLYSEGRMVFWRTLAYIAVFHFPGEGTWDRNQAIPKAIREGCGLKLKECVAAKQAIDALPHDVQNALVCAPLDGDPVSLWEDPPTDVGMRIALSRATLTADSSVASCIVRSIMCIASSP